MYRVCWLGALPQTTAQETRLIYKLQTVQFLSIISVCVLKAG